MVERADNLWIGEGWQMKPMRIRLLAPTSFEPVPEPPLEPVEEPTPVTILDRHGYPLIVVGAVEEGFEDDEDPVRTAIRDVVIEKLGDEFAEELDARQFGRKSVDGLDWIEVIEAVQEHFGIRLEDEDLAGKDTLAELEELVKKMLTPPEPEA